jgi:hypothetical protein
MGNYSRTGWGVGDNLGKTGCISAGDRQIVIDGERISDGLANTASSSGDPNVKTFRHRHARGLT